jgi:DNA-binding transcriptional LysR family regulator
MFRWDDLRVLLAIHRGGSMAAAGAALGVDASTASRRLRALEEEVGLLFDRGRGGLAPTPLARRLLPYAEEAEATFLQVQAVVASTDVAPTGVVRLAVADAFATHVLCPALPGFLDAHPGLDLQLVVSSGRADLLRREADLAVRFVRPSEPDLVAWRVTSIGPYRAVVHRSYAERHPDLSAQVLEWIGWDDSCAHLPEARLYEQVVGREPRVAADNLVVMIEALRAGAGALLLPEPLLAQLDDLIVLDEPDPGDFALPAWLVTHQALHRVPRIRAVVDWLVGLAGDPDANSQ